MNSVKNDRHSSLPKDVTSETRNGIPNKKITEIEFNTISQRFSLRSQLPKTENINVSDKKLIIDVTEYGKPSFEAAVR